METILNKAFERSIKPLETPAAAGETALEKVFEKYMKPRDPQKPEEAWLKLADTAWPPKRTAWSDGGMESMLFSAAGRKQVLGRCYD